LGKLALMKLCMSVGLLKVKVGLVARVIKTLLELIDVFPDCCRAALTVDELMVGIAGVAGTTTGAAGVIGVAGVLDWQTDGCPAHEYPD
jgi:hypothetical protein